MSEKNYPENEKEENKVNVKEGFQEYPETTQRAAKTLVDMISETSNKDLSIKVVERGPLPKDEADVPDEPEAA